MIGSESRLRPVIREQTEELPLEAYVASIAHFHRCGTVCVAPTETRVSSILKQQVDGTRSAAASTLAELRRQ